MHAIGLHRKPADILRLLARSGESGLSVERIRAAVWPGEKMDRKCDIQAYISKLRKALNRAYPGDYGIFRDRDRYILRKIGK
jgi:DNA-binding winged helix-turn-helix (wHTH) protein